ncbi:hypothetical protein LPJ61_004809 [Coemansia biformis]|uniref:Uncharacterized protein n=1 Tax=Coemansia biformis TaxID=1286918 RepID=A0A9W7YA28_9FUNG|nr:hypothetical protein LPJ61_004809 [Coemansia biformis]
MEHRWQQKISTFIHRKEQPTAEEHILGNAFDPDMVNRTSASHITRQLCAAAHCTGQTDRDLKRTLKVKRDAAYAACARANGAAQRVAQVKALGYIRSLYRQYRTPIFQWLLGAIAVQPSECGRCGQQLTRDHAAECVNAALKLRNTRAYNARLTPDTSRVMRNPIDAAIAGLKKDDITSAVHITYVINEIHRDCLGRGSLIKRFVSLADA